MVNAVIDEETGLYVHYGTIYGNDVSSFVLDEIVSSGRDLNYEEGLKQLKEDFISHIRVFCEDNYITVERLNIDDLWDQIEQEFNDNYESMNDTTYLYEEDGYVIEYHTNDNSLIILKSPYVCYAAMCSPCFLNGGYIKDKGALLTYALGEDFYDEYAPLMNEVFEKVSIVEKSD